MILAVRPRGGICFRPNEKLKVVRIVHGTIYQARKKIAIHTICRYYCMHGVAQYRIHCDTYRVYIQVLLAVILVYAWSWPSAEPMRSARRAQHSRTSRAFVSGRMGRAVSRSKSRSAAERKRGGNPSRCPELSRWTLRPRKFSKVQ